MHFCIIGHLYQDDEEFMDGDEDDDDMEYAPSYIDARAAG
jgi:hypothetical protein